MVATLSIVRRTREKCGGPIRLSRALRTPRGQNHCSPLFYLLLFTVKPIMTSSAAAVVNACGVNPCGYIKQSVPAARWCMLFCALSPLVIASRYRLWSCMGFRASGRALDHLERTPKNSQNKSLVADSPKCTRATPRR